MTAWLPALVVCLVSAPAFAGEIRGTVTVGGKSIGQGIAIEAHCREQVHSISTDKYGSYRISFLRMARVSFKSCIKIKPQSVKLSPLMTPPDTISPSRKTASST